MFFSKKSRKFLVNLRSKIAYSVSEKHRNWSCEIDIKRLPARALMA